MVLGGCHLNTYEDMMILASRFVLDVLNLNESSRLYNMGGILYT
jgi:hypothetical protein